ncbi:hypothetical protein RSal33209_2069 [Renibacterium salmoninarum ATCC 33209]|uniref:Uncharacterized protein n=1 Tax=Renibacterium salmoninarum (strain ATCC 33209 / DSM 20767 / JCM 11484 / NBRC 15589 / NCIMB 2235) TaxID=288705 RepID=A9WSL3_RENSM|nr:hypothetical protein RSal33209_2069 [Renibacterium salmoninarum ATCC 33209]
MSIALSFEAAQQRDLSDPLREHRDSFIGSDDPQLVAYLDGNSPVGRCGPVPTEWVHSSPINGLRG